MAAQSEKQHPAVKGMRPVVIGGIINVFLVFIKISAGILGNSYALFADGIESATDIFKSAIVWLGLRVAAKAPDSDHPYGHGKAEPISGAFVALAMLASGVLIIVQSFRNMAMPHPAPKAFTLYILGIIILLKEVLFRYVKKIGTEINSLAVHADAWHHRSDAVSSLAAFVGISIAIIMGPGFEIADDIAAMAASLIIIFNAYRILKPALREMMDAAPTAPVEQEVRKVASEVSGVAGLDKCYVRKMGFDYYVDLHVKVDGNLSVFEGHEIAHRVKKAILESIPGVTDVLVHIEPASPGNRKQETVKSER